MKIKGYEIIDCLNKEKFSSYLIYGQNKGLINEKINQIISKYKKINKDIEIIKFDCQELLDNPDKLYNEFNTFSLTGNKKIVHILNTQDALVNIISESILPDNKNPFCIIICESNELKPTSKLRKFFEKEKHVGILPCYYETENDVKEFISKTFENESVDISEDLKLILIKHLGTERNIIKNELEKIILFLKNKKNFSEKDILDCLNNNHNFNFEDLNYSICDSNLIKLDKIINQLYLEGINPIALLRSVSKHFQKILFINEKINNGLNINESLKLLKPPIFFLYLNQFKKHVINWKTKTCYKIIERIFNAERLCKLNSKIAKIICWRTLRNISSIKYKKI